MDIYLCDYKSAETPKTEGRGVRQFQTVNQPFCHQVFGS